MFKDCREIRWSLHTEESKVDTGADVIGFWPGQDRFREPAVLTTDLFELTISFDRVEIRDESPAER